MSTWLNPAGWYRYLHESRYVHFFVIGMTGVGINLAITAFLTELVFGREHYFTGYVIGLMVNLLYNFILHTRVTFKTKGNHTRRLIIFLVYSLILAYLQAVLTKTLVAIVGVDWYLLVIPCIILAFSIMTFVLFKFVLFRNDPDEKDFESQGSELQS